MSLIVLFIVGPLLNVMNSLFELNSTVLNPVLGFSVLYYNGEIQEWKVNAVYK